MEEPTHAYVGICTCGQTVAIMIDRAKHRKDIAQTLAEWIIDDLVVERRTIEQARNEFGGCECQP